jgi:hypothetical protein
LARPAVDLLGDPLPGAHGRLLSFEAEGKQRGDGAVVIEQRAAGFAGVEMGVKLRAVVSS